MKSAIILAITFLAAASAGGLYENHKVYKIIAKTEVENQNLLRFESNPQFDFWAPVNKVGNPVVVMVSPESQKQFEDYLQENHVDFQVEIEDVQKTVDEETAYHSARKPYVSGRISFDQYYQYDQINAYIAQLAQSYPNIVSVEQIGRSYENRPINLVRIQAPGASNRPQIYIEGGIHAREWISPATILYLLQELIENPSNRHLIERVNWLIIPSLNPDGYQYTWTTQRLWRKTRSPGTSCYGVDGNRNFAYYWMENGASSNQCSETYAGARAFSEVETQALRDSILRENNVALFLSVHSYGQYLLYPWGWTSALPDNAQELENLGQQFNRAVSAVAGTTYRVGSSTNVLYSASGNSVDYSKGVAGVPLAYTIELPGGGLYGFDLPASRIRGVVEETFEGFRVFAEYVASYKR